MTRRNLLWRLLLILGASAVRWLAPVSGAAAQAATLASAEVDDLVAFAEVLVEGRTLGALERSYLVAHIEDRVARRADSVALYRAALGTLERLAGRRMAALDLRERIDLVTRHRLGIRLVRPDEDLGPLADDVRRLRTRVAPDLVAGYYGSPAGWKTVGYDTFPGQCGDLTRYVRRES